MGILRKVGNGTTSPTNDSNLVRTDVSDGQEGREAHPLPKAPVSDPAHSKDLKPPTPSATKPPLKEGKT